MTSSTVNFDAAIGGASGLLPPSHREDVSGQFGDALQGALDHGDDSRDGAVGRRSRARRDHDSDSRDSQSDGPRHRETTATDVVPVASNGEPVRPMPVPPPPEEKGTGTTADGEASVETTADLTDPLTGQDRLTGSAVSVAAQTESARQAALRSRGHARDSVAEAASNLPETAGDVASNLAALLQKMAEGNASDQAITVDPSVSDGAWRRTMVTRLSNLVESSPSDRTNNLPGSRGSQLAAAAELNRALAAIATHSSDEQSSVAAKAIGAVGIAEMFDVERPASLDRHTVSQLNHLRLESSMVTPLPLTAEGAGTETAAIEQQTLDTELPEQIVQSIRLQALDLGGEARVRLRPEYLGEVVVAVKVDRGAVTATLQADTPAVRRWIETHEASLRTGLAEHGLHLDRLIVSEPAKSESDPEERRRQSADEPPAHKQPRRSPRNEEEAGTFEVVV